MKRRRMAADASPTGTRSPTAEALDIQEGTDVKMQALFYPPPVPEELRAVEEEPTPDVTPSPDPTSEPSDSSSASASASGSVGASATASGSVQVDSSSGTRSPSVSRTGTRSAKATLSSTRTQTQAYDRSRLQQLAALAFYTQAQRQCSDSQRAANIIGGIFGEAGGLDSGSSSGVQLQQVFEPFIDVASSAGQVHPFQVNVIIPDIASISSASGDGLADPCASFSPTASATATGTRSAAASRSVGASASLTPSVEASVSASASPLSAGNSGGDSVTVPIGMLAGFAVLGALMVAGTVTGVLLYRRMVKRSGAAAGGKGKGANKGGTETNGQGGGRDDKDVDDASTDEAKLGAMAGGRQELAGPDGKGGSNSQTGPRRHSILLPAAVMLDGGNNSKATGHSGSGGGTIGIGGDSTDSGSDMMMMRGSRNYEASRAERGASSTNSSPSIGDAAPSPLRPSSPIVGVQGVVTPAEGFSPVNGSGSSGAARRRAAASGTGLLPPIQEVPGFSLTSVARPEVVARELHGNGPTSSVGKTGPSRRQAPSSPERPTARFIQRQGIPVAIDGAATAAAGASSSSSLGVADASSQSVSSASDSNHPHAPLASEAPPQPLNMASPRPPSAHPGHMPQQQPPHVTPAVTRDDSANTFPALAAAYLAAKESMRAKQQQQQMQVQQTHSSHSIGSDAAGGGAVPHQQ